MSFYGACKNLYRAVQSSAEQGAHSTRTMVLQAANSHDSPGTDILQANFPNLRRLFIEARTDSEEREVSRRAVSEVFCVANEPANSMA